MPNQNNESASVKYLDAVRGILDQLQNTQLDNVEKAVDMVIASLKNGGVIWCSAIGHSNEQDFINRAGGLASVKHFSYSISTNAPVPEAYNNRPRTEEFSAELENISYALKASNVRAGDVMFMGSVSGKNINPVQLAIACHEMGVSVVGMTSLGYTAQVTSLHPSGKKLCDVADVVIDNCAPYGDAAVHIEGYEKDLLPVSGVSMIAIGWMIWGRVMEKMAAVGDAPTVFNSVNREGGWAMYQKSLAEYNKRGY